MRTQDFTAQTKELINKLKGVCASFGLGNSGSEFDIITQVFLYKFMNDKFGYEIKELDPKLKKAESWEKEISEYTDKQYEMLLLRMSPDSAKLKREHYLSYLYNKQDKEEFAKLFDDTLRDIAIFNTEIFSVKTETGAKITLFDELSTAIKDPSKRDAFCKAIINQLVNFSFEKIFDQKFDFFSTIFEYLIKDYNKDGGGKYAEYYTPHAVSKIMASILVDKPVSNVTCYDPSAGSGTLLMNLAHAIGEDRCTIYSQDISQKSSSMLRLNLILNNLVHSIQNIIQGNTLVSPYPRPSRINILPINGLSASHSSFLFSQTRAHNIKLKSRSSSDGSNEYSSAKLRIRAASLPDSSSTSPSNRPNFFATCRRFSSNSSVTICGNVMRCQVEF